MTRVDSTSKEKKEVKNKKISESIKTTKKKRKHQKCTCYELKINHRRLNAKQREALSMVFVEAKWLYNDVLNSGLHPSQYDDKTTTVMVKYPDGFQERQLQYLSAQMKQKLLSNMSSSIKTLNTLKKKGRKVGALKFISEYTSIGLKQYTKTHKFDFQRNRVHIQNIPGWVRVHGLKQIPHNAEIADAKLIKRASGYYVKVTTFMGKNPVDEQEPLTTVVGVDMGVATSLTLSNGYEFSAYVEEPERLRRLQRRLSRQSRSSNAYGKTRNQLGREYEKMNHMKDDAANKIVSEILKNDLVFFQDELIGQWKRRWGRKLHHGVLGRVKSKLNNAENAYMLDRSVATTQTCVCGKKNKIPLNQRIYSCGCGRELPRDVHSAQMMVVLGRALVPMGCREFTLVENVGSWGSSEFYEHSVKPEALTLKC